MKSAKHQNPLNVKRAEWVTRATQPQNWMRLQLNSQQNPPQKTTTRETENNFMIRIASNVGIQPPPKAVIWNELLGAENMKKMNFSYLLGSFKEIF